MEYPLLSLRGALLRDAAISAPLSHEIATLHSGSSPRFARNDDVADLFYKIWKSRRLLI